MKTKIANPKVLQTKTELPTGYHLEPGGVFRIDQYDSRPAFAGFLPGIGGPDGVPLWCLYVNRGQAVSSFGVANKNHAILEFLPANWAYQMTPIQGFRTFCFADEVFLEPFGLRSRPTDSVRRTLWIEMDRIKIREDNEPFGLRFEVVYFSPVSRPLGSLIRLLTVTNLTVKTRKLFLLDGLAQLLPAGFTELGIKTMRRIYEAYASVRLIDGRIPFYAARVRVHDEAEVEEVQSGNFYASWLSEGDYLLPVEPYYDPDVIFGTDQDLLLPRHFTPQGLPDRSRQVGENKLPCALTPVQTALGPQESLVLVSIAGMAPNESLLKTFLSNFQKLSDFESASRQSRKTIETLTAPAFTLSGDPRLDGYARQNFLDNILRGGIPYSLPSRRGPVLLHLYSRRHGDAERDYNFFDLPACPLSSGEGNYRDICQNRRNNLWFYPQTADAEIRMFASLLQPDGYNPLSVKGYRWLWPQSDNPVHICPSEDSAAQDAFVSILKRPFLPGELLAWANLYAPNLPDRHSWLEQILSRCDVHLEASGHEGGYWIDHWTYITDLLESYEALYPERIQTVLTEPADIEWFCEPAQVVDRRQKYLLRKKGLRQLHAVQDAPCPPVPLPPVTLFGKLCALLALKIVSLDFEGRGVEMEAGRPGWNDALNGLPGLFGSSTCETAEICRLTRWLLRILPTIPDTRFPEAVADLLEAVLADVRSDYSWHRAADIRESYRRKIYQNSSDKTRLVKGAVLKKLLQGILARCEKAVQESINPQNGLLHTYYFHTPQPPSANRLEDIRSFEAHPLPLFLEGQVHWLRICDTQTARRIAAAVRQSPLLDPQLKMYKLNESLESCSPEIGRARTFTRGWFENESVWLHMTYKYLLELLKHGLHEDFFEDAQTMLVPFMKPQVYGRSILENSSFIASSVCPDPEARGRGFVARLSGSTAEFIHIWLLLTVGARPFRLDAGRLIFDPAPALPGEWFTKQPHTIRWKDRSFLIPENAFACALLGDILLVYHNPARKNTYGPSSVRPVQYILDEQITITNPYLTEEAAEKIRNRKIERLDIHLG
ncbi:MAG TPA: hypothetical protein PKY88_06390 [Anaerohalosphaeraceae bacterium]|nr:hypothetical protein [Anaerohalosphaeraceae bacterium]